MYSLSELLRSIEDDFDDVVRECGIRVIEKVKLRNAIRSISPGQVIVDKEETTAILAMEQKLHSLIETLSIIAEAEQS